MPTKQTEKVCVLTNTDFVTAKFVYSRQQDAFFNLEFEALNHSIKGKCAGVSTSTSDVHIPIDLDNSNISYNTI